MTLVPSIENLFTISKCKVNDAEISVINLSLETSAVRTSDLEYSNPITDTRKLLIGNYNDIKVYRVWLLPGDTSLKLYSEDETTVINAYFDNLEKERYRVFTIQTVPIDDNTPIEISYHLLNLEDSMGSKPHENQINGSDYNVNLFDLYEKNKLFYLQNKHLDGRFGNFYISQGFAKYFVGTFVR